MQCTQCSFDNVQKLGVIYQMGTQQINTTSRTSGGGAGYGGDLVAVSALRTREQQEQVNQ